MEAGGSEPLGGKTLSDLSQKDLGHLAATRPTDIAELSRQAFEKQMRQPAKHAAAAGYANDGMPSLDNALSAGAGANPGQGKQLPLSGFTREQYDAQRREDAEKEKGPMTGAQYRQQQALGVQAEMANANAGNPAPPSYEEFLAANYPHLLEDDESRKKANPPPQVEVPLTEEELMRLEALKELDRSQMPATQGEDGLLVKTIEHYTFADGEDSVNFYVHFDKDLFPGAASFIQESQVKIDSRATSLDIRLKDVPVSDKKADLLAEWRLTLSPLFGRVEASLTSHKMRNGKLSVKLYKAKTGPWKKGVKYS